MINNRNIIGVVGGMGPQATGEFYNMLIQKSVRNFGAKNNDDFPEIIIDSIPVPDFINNIGSLPVAESMLTDRIRKLNDAGVSEICLACNTAHILLKEFRKISRVPVVSIMEEVFRVVELKKFKRIGLFATPTTNKMNLYNELNKNGKRLFLPNVTEQSELEGIIRAIIVGENRVLLRPHLIRISASFTKRTGVEVIILGCTELPLVCDTIRSVPIISSLDVLANRVLANYYDRKSFGRR